MDMILSFGYFARLLVTNKIEKSITQQDLISNIVNIVDASNPIFYLSPEKTGETVDKSLIRKIIIGEKKFKTAINIELPSFEEVTNSFHLLTDYFDDSGKVRILLCLYDIIREDKLINTITKESFLRFFGESKDSFLNRQEFSFIDVCVKTLLYTVCTDIEKYSNKMASEFLKSLKNEKTFIEHQNDILNIYSLKKWNAIESVLTLPKLEPALVEIDGYPPRFTINKNLFYTDDESYKESSSQYNEKTIELQREIINRAYNLSASIKNDFEKKR